MALQYLTPAQRAILLLRDVLEWEARDVASWLNLSVAAVNSGLQRARHALQQCHLHSEKETPPLTPHLQSLLDRYVTCWEQADIPGLVGLLREDAWFTMPPLPLWFQGQATIATWLATTIFLPGRSFRLLPTHANGSPAFGLYRRQDEEEVYQLLGIIVLGVEGEQIGCVVGFMDVSSLSCFALPSTFPELL
jgi:RNA polymerase sigma-70 factor (ECF subfamily)